MQYRLAFGLLLTHLLGERRPIIKFVVRHELMNYNVFNDYPKRLEATARTVNPLFLRARATAMNCCRGLFSFMGTHTRTAPSGSSLASCCHSSLYGRSEAGTRATLSNFTLRRRSALGALVKRYGLIGSSPPSASWRSPCPCGRRSWSCPFWRGPTTP